MMMKANYLSNPGPDDDWCLDDTNLEFESKWKLHNSCKILTWIQPGGTAGLWSANAELLTDLKKAE